MNGVQLRQARKQKRWTQEMSAKKLRLTQGYLSMLEKGERVLTDEITERVVRVFGLKSVDMPIRIDLTKLAFTGDENLSSNLATIGYPGFSHIAPSRLKNPGEILVSALSADNLDSRIVEALPWLVAEVSELSWSKVVLACKVKNLQNRLGFVTTLARLLAERRGEKQKIAALMKREELLVDSRLLKEDTLCSVSMTEAERNWVLQNRTPEAKFWNILSDLKADHLSYAI